MHQVIRYVTRTRFEELVREMQANSRFTSYDYQDARELGMTLDEYHHSKTRRVTEIMMVERSDDGDVMMVVYKESPHA